MILYTPPHIDSVYSATYMYGYDSTRTWQYYGLSRSSKIIDTTIVDLNEYAFFADQKTQTGLHPWDSTYNQEYFIAAPASPIAPFSLVIGRKLLYASEVSPNPPNSYYSQTGLMFPDNKHFVFYPGGGGPYIREGFGTEETIETLVYAKDNTGERGVPLNHSLVSSVQNPLAASINLYPNPAKNQVQLRVSQEANWEATLYSMDGMAIQHFAFEGDSHTMDISAIENGLYFIRITSPGYISNVKLQVSK